MFQNEPFIIYKDKNFLAVYKPAGLLVHPVKVSSSKFQASSALTDWLLENFPEVKNVGDSSIGLGQANLRPGIVHRLDKDVSGIMLVARNQKYFKYLKNLFQTRQIKKNYLALVYGKIKSKIGIIDKPISIKSGTIKRTVYQGKDEKGAVTEYRVIKFLKLKVESDEEKEQIFSLVEVSPKTGRTHQIRIHLASIGHPIVGDTLYGKKTNPFSLKRIFLHAESLEFSPAEGERIKLEVALPEELEDLLKSGKLE
ncbi:MAG: RluA family pseudouridine synthase [Spirochaetota bacterium]